MFPPSRHSSVIPSPPYRARDLLFSPRKSAALPCPCSGRPPLFGARLTPRFVVASLQLALTQEGAGILARPL